MERKVRNPQEGKSKEEGTSNDTHQEGEGDERDGRRVAVQRTPQTPQISP